MDGCAEGQQARPLARALAALDAVEPRRDQLWALTPKGGPAPLPAALAERLGALPVLDVPERPTRGVHPDDVPVMHQAWDRATCGPDRVAEVVLRAAEVPAGGAPWFRMVLVDLVDVPEYGVVVAISSAADPPSPELALAASEEQFRALAESLPVGVLLTDLQGRFRFANTLLHDMLGTCDADLAGRRWQRVVDDGDRPEVIAALGSVNSPDREPFHGSLHVVRPADGEGRDLRTVAQLVVDAQDRPTGIIATVADVTEELAAQRLQEQLQQIVEETSDLVLLITPGEGVFHANAAARETFGPVVGQLARDLLTPPSRRLFEDVIAAELDEGRRWTGDLRATDRHGRVRVLSSVIQPHLADGRLHHVSATLRDVTAERDVARELAHQARLDPLTGLPNRTALMEHLEMVSAWSVEEDRSVAVLFIDLDNLKVVNDSLGHRAGDDLLAATADRLRAAIGDRWFLGRFGGDEFVVVCDDLRSASEAEAAARHVLGGLQGAVDVVGVRVQLAASIGVAAQRRRHPDAETLLREADAAMYEAKRRGRSRVAVFDDALEHRVHRRLRLEADLRQAIDHGEIEAWLQPIVDVATGRLDGCEALARWPGSGPPPVPPVEFIGLAEESGLITTLGLQVFESALAGAAAVRAAHPSLAELRIGSNLSGRQLTEPDLDRALLDRIEASGIPPEHVVMELTETVLIEQGDDVDRVFRSLRDAGVTLALDDFGSGYSSLSHLRRYPIDVIKLDTSYVQSFTTDPGTRIIAEAVVQMADRLDLMVVAEGVETVEQLEAVRELGVAKAQGYLLGRPAPAAELAAERATSGSGG